MERLGGRSGLAGGIPVALEIALFDLQGKLLGVPVSTLLGGKRRDRIPFCYPIFPLRGEGEVEPNIERVRRLKAQGFTRIRKYIGPALDAEERFLRQLRDSFGQEVEIKSLDLSARFYWQEALALFVIWVAAFRVQALRYARFHARCAARSPPTSSPNAGAGPRAESRHTPPQRGRSGQTTGAFAARNRWVRRSSSPRSTTMPMTSRSTMAISARSTRPSSSQTRVPPSTQRQGARR